METTRTVVDGNIHKETTETVTTPTDIVMRDLAVQFNASLDRDVAALAAYNASLAREQVIRDAISDDWEWGKDHEANMPEDFDENMAPIEA